MPFAVLQFNASDNLMLSRFVLSAPDALKAHLEEQLCIETEGESGEAPEEHYCIWKGNDCILSNGYYVDAHEILDKIEAHGWSLNQASTSLTGSGVLCQTYVFKMAA